MIDGAVGPRFASDGSAARTMEPSDRGPCRSDPAVAEGPRAGPAARTEGRNIVRGALSDFSASSLTSEV